MMKKKEYLGNNELEKNLFASYWPIKLFYLRDNRMFLVSVTRHFSLYLLYVFHFLFVFTSSVCRLPSETLKAVSSSRSPWSSPYTTYFLLPVHMWDYGGWLQVPTTSWRRSFSLAGPQVNSACCNKEPLCQNLSNKVWKGLIVLGNNVNCSFSITV